MPDQFLSGVETFVPGGAVAAAAPGTPALGTAGLYVEIFGSG
jgi:hypothetical protein